MSSMTTGLKFDHLAAIRGIAAFVVLLAHIVQIFWLRIVGLDSWLYVVSSTTSYYAVVVFFVLSGFLITHSIESNVRRNGELNLLEFFAARIARLYPPFLFAVVLSIAIYFALDFLALPGRNGAMRLDGDLYAARETVNWSFSQLRYVLPIGQGLLEINGALWSLYIEAKLYVLFACLFCLQQGRRTAAIIIATILTAYAGLRLNPEFLRYAAIWLVGACAYYGVGKVKLHRKSGFVLSAVLILLILAIDLVGRAFNLFPAQITGRLIIIDVVIAVGIAWVLFSLKPPCAIGHQIADYSYSLYAIHFPILLFVQSVLISMGEVSIGWVIVFSIAAGVLALTIAKAAGVLENAKDTIQRHLLSVWFGIDARIRNAK